MPQTPASSHSLLAPMARPEKAWNPDLPFVVAGLGQSGFWAARLLAQKGARVILSEERDHGAFPTQMLQTLQQEGVTLELGGHRDKTFIEANIIVVSPGIPLDLRCLVLAREAGIPILGELEMASRFASAPIIAVTGTNGKSTVTSMIGEMLRNGGQKVFVGGNLGTPLAAYMARGEAVDALVLEVSSFQLDTIERFHPLVAVLLNISPDHLDRYPDYEAYVHSKFRIFENQTSGDHLILNDDDPVLSSLVPQTPVQVHRYGLAPGPERSACLDHGMIHVSAASGEETFDPGRFQLPGSHNLSNLLSVVLAGRVLGLSARAVQKTVDEFQGLSNRLEYVDQVDGIRFYNDSKATNVDAAIKAVQSFDGPLILIAGGRHKGASYGPLFEAAGSRLKGAVFIGESREILASACGEAAVLWKVAESLEEAVQNAFGMAREGDVVLLAPACSSFDMFSDYAHRGLVFKQAVGRLRYGQEG